MDERAITIVGDPIELAMALEEVMVPVRLSKLLRTIMWALFPEMGHINPSKWEIN